MPPEYQPGVGFRDTGWGFNLSKQVVWTSALLGGTAVAALTYLYSTSSSGKTKKTNATGVPGLHNLGNTCYANALLQGLASLPSFARWLRDMENRIYTTPGEFLHELRGTVLHLNDPTASAYSALGVTQALAAHQWNINIGVEHDLHELLNVFVTTWEEELGDQRKRIVAKSLLDACPPYSENVVESDPKEMSHSERRRLLFERCAAVVRDDAVLRAPCFGLTATELRCCQLSCGYRKVRYDTFGVISLGIPRGFMGPLTLEHLLRKYFFMEVIRGATCDRCKERNGRADSGLFKKQGLSKLPQTMIIRIERVGVLPSGSQFKLSDHVQFGETLDVRDFCFYRNKRNDYELSMASKEENQRTPEVTSRIVGGGSAAGLAPASSRSPAARHGLAQPYNTIDGGSFMAERREAARYKYQLRAVSEHRGVPETGHFVTYRRGIADQHAWYLTNDAEVSRVPYVQVSKAQAYLLYYERIQPNRWHKGSVADK